MYYKVTNEQENHNGFQYSTGLNIDTSKFQETGNIGRGLHFTTLKHITEFLIYGTYVREVSIPKNAKIVKNQDGYTLRANRIILGKRYLIEDFIRKFKEKFDEHDWYCISHYPKLSEDFIRENKDRVCWSAILENQTLPEEMIIEFKDKMDPYELLHHQKQLSEEFKIEIRNEFKDYLLQE